MSDIDSTIVVAPPIPRRRHPRRPPGASSVDDPSRRPSPLLPPEGRWMTTACLAVVTLLALSSLPLDSDDASNYGRRMLREEETSSAFGELDGHVDAGAPTAESTSSSVEPMSPLEVERYLAMTRLLMEGIDTEEMEGIVAVPEAGLDATDTEPDRDDAEEEREAAAPSGKSDYESLVSASVPLPKYDLASLLSLITLYTNTFAVLVYDPASDEFYALYSKKHHWASSVEKMIRSLSTVTYLIRKNMADELTTGNEVAVAVSSGDYPAVKITDCVRLKSGVATGHEARKLGGVADEEEGGCSGENAPPILHFGSTFRQSAVFPNMISMPMPEPHHLKCFEQWATHGGVCDHRRRMARIGQNGLFGDEFDGGKTFDWSSAMWDGLIPQVVWRGTDFVYLQTLYPELGRPNLESHIAPHLDRLSTIDLKKQAIDALEERKQGLVPRWKGVLHTAQAELEVDELIELKGRNDNEKRRMRESILPWCNIKFSHYVTEKAVKVPTKGSAEYKMWERMNFPAAGDSMGTNDLAKYRYHIDLGGGGGTTWSGTIQKLALPGLLFHHVTPTKDYIHDYMKPWKHYVPVAPDLRDLKEKFEWAEAHPNQARKIARDGTRLARYFSSDHGMEVMYRKNVEDPLRAVLDAYVPVSQTEHRGRAWRKVIMDIEGEGGMLPILKCTGKSVSSCERMVGKGGFYDPAQIRRLENAAADANVKLRH